MRNRISSLLAASLCGLLLGFASLPAAAQTTAPNEWTWMGGRQTGTFLTYPNGLPGVYGTLGMPAAGNIPGARDSAATWTDSKGNLWLFGGEGVDDNGKFGQLNDLWELNPTTQQWAWMGGSSTLPASCAGSATVACGQPGTYGTLGSPAAANGPGGRSNASYWTDNDGNFWLYGGVGFDAGQILGELNDLWEFNSTTKEWTWMSGSRAVGSNGGQSGVYGTLGATAAANVPGGRDSATNWVDKQGQFWLYGGEGFDSQGNFGDLDDLWKLDPATNEWTWVSGSNSDQPVVCAASALAGTCGWLAIYGTIGVPAPGISPGSRVGAAGWTDSSDNLWLFGGLGPVYNSAYNFGELDQYDLWEFNPSTQQWAWMSGNNATTCSDSGANSCAEVGGIYGTQGVPSIANIPPGRDNAVAWTDAEGNFWLFGGEQPLLMSGTGFDCNDVWVFEPAANEWAWTSPTYQWGGTSCFGPPPAFGVLGSPAAANTPSGRMGAASWTDSSGNLWIFGGYGASEIGFYELNELWSYQPAAPAPKPSFEIIASPNPISIGTPSTGTPAATTGTTTVKILVADGFDSPVTLTAADGTVDGVTAATGSFSPTTITGAGSSTLTISVTGAAFQMGQPIPLSVTATGGGLSQSTLVIVEPTAIGQLAAPTFSLPAGTYTTAQTVAISGSGGCIYYTTDGTTPTVGSLVYVNPITIMSTTTLKAIVIYVPGGVGNQSAVSSATYGINPLAPQTAAPVFSLPAGAYTSAQTVTISDTMSGASIYYTTDGKTTPTTSSPKYTGAITVSSTETIQAIAIAPGFSSSAVASSTYTIPPGFTITAAPVTVTAGATSGNTSAITLTPTGGFTGSVNLTAAITSGPSGGIQPTFSFGATTPAIIPATGNGAATLTITTTASSESQCTSENRKPQGIPWYSGGGATLAYLLLFGIPARWRRWRKLLALSLLLVAFAGGMTACGGSGGKACAPVVELGTPSGAYTITITGVSNSITSTGTVNLAVQ